MNDPLFNFACAMGMIMGIMTAMIGLAVLFVPELKDIDRTYFHIIGILPFTALPVLFLIMNGFSKWFIGENKHGG